MRIASCCSFSVPVFRIDHDIANFPSLLSAGTRPRGEIFVSHFLFPRFRGQVSLLLVFSFIFFLYFGFFHVVIGIFLWFWNILFRCVSFPFSVSFSLVYGPIMLRVDFLYSVFFFSISPYLPIGATAPDDHVEFTRLVKDFSDVSAVLSAVFSRVSILWRICGQDLDG